MWLFPKEKSLSESLLSHFYRKAKKSLLSHFWGHFNYLGVRGVLRGTPGHNKWCGFWSESQSYNLSGPARDTPPYRAIPFRDSIAEGGIAPICLVFRGYRRSIAEVPLWRGGYRTSTSHALQGETLRKGGGGIAPNWPCWDTKNPIARNRGVSLR